MLAHSHFVPALNQCGAKTYFGLRGTRGIVGSNFIRHRSGLDRDKVLGEWGHNVLLVADRY